jgi:hypothetical protein
MSLPDFATITKRQGQAAYQAADVNGGPYVFAAGVRTRRKHVKSVYC